jgi:hypothetical protein
VIQKLATGFVGILIFAADCIELVLAQPLLLLQKSDSTLFYKCRSANGCACCKSEAPTLPLADFRIPLCIKKPLKFQ